MNRIPWPSTLIWMALPLAMSMVDQGIVLIAITLVVVPIAAVSFARSGAAWRRLGKGRFAIEQPPAPRRGGRPSPSSERAIQATEVRQMLEAESYRRTRRGEAPLDVEAEVERRLADL